MIQIECLYCHQKFYADEKKRKFCNSSCAASYNNKHPKRLRTKKCKGCGVLIQAKWTYCQDCIKARGMGKYSTPIKEYTLQQIKEKGKTWEYSNMRTHSRRVMKDKLTHCENCGYEKHVEVCHINQVKDFPLETKVIVINSPENLVVLCRNCHWEMDHGLLKLKR